MNIQLIIKDDHPTHKLNSLTLHGAQIQLIPQIGDQITDGQTTRTIKARTFQYGANEIIVTLDCRY